MRKTALNLIANIGLLFGGVVMVFSGLLLQIKYHIGQHGKIDENITVFNIDYFGWSDIHKWSIVFVSALMIYHIVQHRKWYKGVIKKKLFRKNTLISILTVTFLIVAITGYIPWFINLGGGDEITRKLFIEIHDKLAILLSVVLIIHVIKRLKWYFTSFGKINKERHLFFNN